jgi:hypothetical protein
MNAEEFVTLWENMKDIDYSPAVGIGVYWRNIPIQNSTVQQYFGKDAWEKVGLFYAPLWGNFKRTTLKEWLNQSRPDYQKFIDEEKVKIGFYDKNGLVYPDFCAISDETGLIGVLGDGSHRYIDCNYLILNGKDLSNDINKCRLDVLCVPNLDSVLSENDIPPTYAKSKN